MVRLLSVIRKLGGEAVHHTVILTKIAHLFEYVGENRFRLLGEDYPCTGELVQYFRAADEAPVVVGRWMKESLRENKIFSL